MAVFDARSFNHHEMVAFRDDPKTGLQAIIAIHDTTLGPAVGGCRMYPYSNTDQALEDVLRLSRGMTYKSALAGLPMGGGKSVIIGNPAVQKNRDLLLAMGEFVESLSGKYVAAEDSGTTVADVKVIGERTTHVSGVLDGQEHGGDPSPYTAYGTYCGILAAVKYRLGRDSVEGLRISLQGAGAVGRHLTRRLIEDGAKVFVADINPDNLKKVEALGAEIVNVDEIFQLSVDVFAPCAMGAVINDRTVDVIDAKIIAGAANNQLATPAEGERLIQRGILYAPDFVINAGGIIDVHYQRVDGNSGRSNAHVEQIAGTLTRIFERSDELGVSTESVAENLAEEIIEAAKEKHKAA
ncbi:Glu/Leu/Phe/Val dehydrogenase [Litorivivens sp.]|uniref:Glu/Leu/Phe/Val family dehydrogenase n=1 Tax=Litorivivens sp. TaxID=2020868 RepID=UPI003563ECFE